MKVKIIIEADNERIAVLDEKGSMRELY